eukprot:scaffold97115_cov66-Phaeocystis_antarctica.AAC.3
MRVGRLTMRWLGARLLMVLHFYPLDDWRSEAVNRGAVEGRPRRAASHGQLTAADDARLRLTDPGFDGVAGALTARVEARPIVVVAPAALGEGGIPALQSPARIALFDEPAQRLRAETSGSRPRSHWRHKSSLRSTRCLIRERGSTSRSTARAHGWMKCERSRPTSYWRRLWCSSGGRRGGALGYVSPWSGGSAE